MRARKVTTRVSGFVAGLGAMATIWPATAPQRYPHNSAMEALRSDAVRVGTDMRRVIERENARIKTSQK